MHLRCGEQVDVEVFEMGTGYKPAEIARQGINKARKDKVDYVIVDTSGRLQIDKALMNELKETKRVSPLTLSKLVHVSRSDSV